MDRLHEELVGRLTDFAQGHVLRFWEELDLREREGLFAELRQLDLKLVDELFHRQTAIENWAELARRAMAPCRRRTGRS